eukprot:TRINITY_DN21984_c0_g1_i1.p2 TRINITY_DN21984_c0_g1~~TRINITY_DN21984_c0_g1_i1.p2  ORF type:complete len:352 (+),score=108.76 TRINITY_DN21984_c0_g1_i1:55-1056(+)
MPLQALLEQLDCFGCCGRARDAGGRADAAEGGSDLDMDENHPMLQDPGLMARPRGALEVQHALQDVKYFESVELVRYNGEATSAEAEGFVKCDSPSPTAGAEEGKSGRSMSVGSGAKIDSRMIANYLDTLGSTPDDNNQFTLVIKGPLRIGGGEAGQQELLAQLDDLETLLLDDCDQDRVQILGVKVCELEIRFPLTSFLNNVLTSGTVRSVGFSNCTLSPPVLDDGVHITRSSTITHVLFKSCGLTDAHLTCFVKALRNGGALLPNLQSLAMSGTFTTGVLDTLCTVLEEDAEALRSIGFPRRHEGFIKTHSLAAARPHLLLNSKKVRHSIV